MTQIRSVHRTCKRGENNFVRKSRYLDCSSTSEFRRQKEEGKSKKDRLRGGLSHETTAASELTVGHADARNLAFSLLLRQAVGLHEIDAAVRPTASLGRNLENAAVLTISTAL